MYASLTSISRALVRDLAELRFGPPVAHVYNPLVYARASYERYLERFGQGPREVMLLGMNPGPWGMAQTGVPFGEVAAVRDWLGIDEPIGKPKAEHSKRPVLGLACTRSEVSGARLWGWARDTFGTPRRFFKRFFVANYCPLVFLEQSGRNRTPDKLPAVEREPLFAACDRALRRTVEYLEPRFVVGVGTFAESRARVALADLDEPDRQAGLPADRPAWSARGGDGTQGRHGVTVGRILHPSPANPQANRNWAATAAAQLAALGIRGP